MEESLKRLQAFLEVLELQPGATIEEVKDQYRTLVKINHPDRFQSDPKARLLAENKLKKINCEFDWLSDHSDLLGHLSQNEKSDAEQQKRERTRRERQQRDDRKREQEQKERSKKRREEQKKHEKEWARWDQKQQRMDNWKREERARQDQRKSAYYARWKRTEAEAEAKRKRILQLRRGWYSLKYGFTGFIDNFIRLFWILFYALVVVAIVGAVLGSVLGQNKKPIAKHVPHISRNSPTSIHKESTPSSHRFVRPSKLNVRESPNASAPIKIVLKSGEAVQVISEVSGWSHISTARLQRNLGWVKSKYLSTRRVVRRSQANRPAHRVPSLTELYPYERRFIKHVCLQNKFSNGLAYNACLQKQLASLAHGPRQPNLFQLEFFERQSITDTCLRDNLFNSVATYNSCLQKQVTSSGHDPGPPDLFQLTIAERQSIEADCLLVKLSNNRAAYNRCLLRRLRSHRIKP